MTNYKNENLSSLKNRLKLLKIKLCKISELKPHENIDRNHLLAVKTSLIKEGLNFPIVTDKDTNTILDSHHRFNIFKELKIKIIPVFYVDYSDDRIILDSWKGQKVTKNEVISAANSGKLFPNKTTKHMFLSNNELKHISSTIPKVDLDIFKLKTIKN